MDNEITIKIDGVDYKIKQSFRALMKFETLTGRSIYEINQNLNDTVTLFFCIVQANNRETFKFSLDEFIDLIDKNQESIEVFSNYLINTAAAEAENNEEKKEPSKKKKTQLK